MSWVKLYLPLLAFLLQGWQVKAQFGYMPQPMFVAPQPAVMVPQAMPMGYGGRMQQPAMGGYPARGNSRGVQKGPWSECSKTCGVDSVRTRSISPCDTSRSSCMEREGCMVPECGVTKIFKEGDEVKVPCHAEAGKKNYKAQWFNYENDKHSWKYVSLEPNRKYMDDKKNLVIASAKVGDQGTYRCNLQSGGTIVAETIWHFSVESPLNTKAAGGGGGIICVFVVIIVICVCVCRYKKMKGGGDETKSKDKGADGGYDYGGDEFDFGY